MCLIIFYDKLKREVKLPNSIILIDPFDEEMRNEIIEDLLDVRRIDHPEDCFSMQISEKSNKALEE